MESTSNMKKEPEEQDSNKALEKRYIDANLFIYAAIDKEIIGEKAKKIISEIKEGKYKAYTATLTIDEFLWRVQKEIGRKLTAEAVNLFFILQNLELVNIDIDLIIKAVDIYKTENLDPRDAIHLAAMKQKNIVAIISSDPDFDKIKGISRIDFTK